MGLETSPFFAPVVSGDAMKDIQRVQGELLSEFIGKSADLRRKQIALWNDIIKNQVDFSSQICSSLLGALNENAVSIKAKTAKGE